MAETAMPESRRRIPLFDILRGVGIILVVFGHVTHDMPIRHFIYGFHMPLFFFISGALFRDRDLECFGAFIRKKARSLLVPYFVFGILTLLWYLVVEVNVRPIEARPEQMLLGLLYGAYTKWIWFNGALWFLPCLFTSELLLWTVLRLSGNSRTKSLTFAALGYLTGEAVLFFSPVPLPFGLEKACRFLLFLVMGRELKDCLAKSTAERKRSFSTFVLLVFTTAVLSLAPESWFGQSSGVSLFYDFVAYVPIAVLGIMLCTILSMGIPRFQPLEFLGKNSIVFFAFQEQTYRIWLGIASTALRVPVETIRMDRAGSVAVTVATFVSILPLVWMWNRRPRRAFP